MPSSSAALRLPASELKQAGHLFFHSSYLSIPKIPYCLLSALLVLFLPVNVWSQTKFNLSLNMGSLSPEDSAASGTFDKGFFFAGSLGVENTAGVEFRMRLGDYSVTSDNPEDLGKDLTLNVSPLTASLNYHFFKKSGFSLFAGGGVGSYFYKVTESALGTLEDGASFGYALSLGGRYAFTRFFFVTAEYEKHFVEKNFFPNSSNFNNTVVTIGIGLSLARADLSDDYYREERKSSVIRGVKKKEPYRYTSAQEALLVEMYQIEMEVKDLGARLKLSSKKLKNKGKQTVKQKSGDDDITELREELEAIRKELDTAKFYINGLEIRRYELGLSSFPVSYHYDYLLQYYPVSPWGLRYRDGFLFYGRYPFRHRFNHRFNNKHLTQEEKADRQRQKMEELLRLKKRTF